MNKGFTLIELLIVIAIIGILAGIVITSIGDETDRASNAVVQLNVSTLRTLAVKEQISSTAPIGVRICLNVNVSWKNGSFAVAGANPNVSYTSTGDFITTGNVGKIYCKADDKRWLIYGVILNGTTAQAFCTDSLGNLANPGNKTNIRKSTGFSC